MENDIKAASKKSNQFVTALENAEKNIYLKVYKYHRYNQTKAAAALGVARNTFRAKMENWGLLSKGNFSESMGD